MRSLCLFFAFSWSLLYGEVARLCDNQYFLPFLDYFSINLKVVRTLVDRELKGIKKPLPSYPIAIIILLLARLCGEVARLYDKAQCMLCTLTRSSRPRSAINRRAVFSPPTSTTSTPTKLAEGYSSASIVSNTPGPQPTSSTFPPWCKACSKSGALGMSCSTHIRRWMATVVDGVVYL